MPTRRTFLFHGLGALTAGLAAGRSTLGAPRWLLTPPPNCPDTGAADLLASHPVALADAAALFRVNGYAFANRWYGDWFAPESIPFHHVENDFPGGEPPGPSETADIVIVGGGLSGLAAAYMLQQHKPILLDLHTRFGGTSQGEQWRGMKYSLGGAYFITPDADSSLERLYHNLGVDRVVRVSPSSEDPFELNGQYNLSSQFWLGSAVPPAQRAAFDQYRALVEFYTENYPDIPLDPSLDNQWIRDLDQITLRRHLEQNISAPIPPVLHAAIQGYCYSSFNAGWDEISAASAWNFIAAEEYGRWVLPGGNSGLTGALWLKLAALERNTPAGCPPRYLRAGCRVIDVRTRGPENILVTYRGGDNRLRSIQAKRVVMACPKHVCRHVLHDLRNQDSQRFDDMQHIHSAAYVVANVLLNQRLNASFYDLFLLNNGIFPEAPGIDFPPVVDLFARATDAVRGDFAGRAPPGYGGSVLTLYWPLPYGRSRFRAIAEDSLNDFASNLGAELDIVLSTLRLPRSAVHHVRLARWGHSMPIAEPGLIAGGIAERLRTPYQNHIFFINQDNWALPAVETCLLEAEAICPQVAEGL